MAAGSRLEGADRRGGLEPVHLRHVDVEEGDVEMAGARGRDGLAPVADQRHLVARARSRMASTSRWFTLLSSATSTLSGRAAGGGGSGGSRGGVGTADGVSVARMGRADGTGPPA